MSTPQNAYHIERHSGVVISQQEQDRLYLYPHVVTGVEYVQEAGLGFYLIRYDNCFDNNSLSLTLFEGDCTQHIKELKKGDWILVLGGGVLPDYVTYGSKNDLVALVVASGNRVVFQAAGLDREKMNGMRLMNGMGLEQLVQLIDRTFKKT